MPESTLKYFTAEWVWRGVMVLWLLVMAWMQSHFVTKELFETKTEAMHQTAEQTRLQIVIMQKDIEYQSLKMTLISDHETRIRLLETKVRQLDK